MECVDFAEKHIPVGQFQWFIDMVSYLQFVIGLLTNNIILYTSLTYVEPYQNILENFGTKIQF